MSQKAFLLIRPFGRHLLSFILSFVLLFIVLFPVTPVQAEKRLRMATTTSTQNSGLLDFLMPEFERVSGLKVDVIAVGTGKALRLGESGDVDLVMVHAPKAELAYVSKGVFTRREPVMHNQFVLLGPADVTLRTSKTGKDKSIARLLSIIAGKKRLFISRGDNSGTHKKELALWKLANIQPSGSWYREVGQGMGNTLIIANEQNAFTLSDDATYYAFKGRLGLVIHSQPDDALKNPYSVMALNRKRYPKANHQGAKILIDWLISESGQKRIAAYRRNGRQLFVPRPPGK